MIKNQKPTGGTKSDSGKAPWDLLPWDAVAEVVRVLQFGATKYAARNWEKGLSHSRVFAATQRHLIAFFQMREDRDPETGIHHLAHAACEVLFALAFAVRGRRDLDDRPGAPPAWPSQTDLTPIVSRSRRG